VTVTSIAAAREKAGKGEPPGAPDWHALLEAAGKGFLGDERNVLIALRNAPELIGLVRFNEFALQIEFMRFPPWRCAEVGARWLDTDDVQLAAWLQLEGIRVRGATMVGECVNVVAQEAMFHPVRYYLENLEWDHQSRLSIWLAAYLGASANGNYLSAVGTKFLISAVARILRPGCQVDHMLVLEGTQGAGKTSAARILSVHPEWFAGSLPDVHSKDAALQLCGRWLIEIAELKAIRSSQLEATKTFLTQCVDTFRAPYARRAAQFPRQCVFIGTTNEHEYLRDRTGNRRYWPVKCGIIDREGLLRDRAQLWAEAVHLYRASHAWHLNETESAAADFEQRERVPISELEHDVTAYLDQLSTDETTVRDVLVYGLRLDPDKPVYMDAARRMGYAVAEAMEQAGWVKVGRIGRQKRTLYRRRKP